MVGILPLYHRLCEIYLVFKLNEIGWVTSILLAVTSWVPMDCFLGPFIRQCSLDRYRKVHAASETTKIAVKYIAQNSYRVTPFCTWINRHWKSVLPSNGIVCTTVCMCVCVCVYMCVCVYVCMYVCVCVYVCMCVCTYVCVNVFMYVRMCVC
jgi:hypothetical protein